MVELVMAQSLVFTKLQNDQQQTFFEEIIKPHGHFHVIPCWIISCYFTKYILLQTQWENLASLRNLRTGLRRSRRTGLKIKGDWYKADFTQLRRPIFELCFNRWPSTKQLEMYKMPRKFDTCYGLLPMLTETQWGQSLYISISNKNDLIILKVAIISFSICWFVKVLLGKCTLVF